MKLIVLFLSLFLLVGCKTQDPKQAEVNAAAQPIEGHECAACGMIVRDQPAPRGQLVHRDGTRAYFCSVADMLSYVDVPSPHGKPASTYVEANDPSADPAIFNKSFLPWIDATTSWYVTGIENPMIMGFPILTYSDELDAQKVSEAMAGKVHNWDSIRVHNLERQEK